MRKLRQFRFHSPRKAYKSSTFFSLQITREAKLTAMIEHPIIPNAAPPPCLPTCLALTSHPVFLMRAPFLSWLLRFAEYNLTVSFCRQHLHPADYSNNLLQQKSCVCLLSGPADLRQFCFLSAFPSVSLMILLHTTAHHVQTANRFRVPCAACDRHSQRHTNQCTSAKTK